ncbi:MAG: alpha/beta hydrolase-fold protein [Thermodesulfobacteriota bacterium]
MTAHGYRLHTVFCRALLLVCLVGLTAGCFDSAQKSPVVADGPKTRPPRRETIPEPRPATAPEPQPARREEKIASLPRPSPPKTVSTEPLDGYKIPAEYVFVPSVRVPDAVVAVSLPADYRKQPDRRFPLVIAFGGAGECAKPPRQGALAWLHYYKADEAAVALSRKVLRESDFRRLATKKEIRAFNRRLAEHHYGGVILACPFSPPLVSPVEPEDPAYEAFIMEELLPELKRRYRVSARGVGVDGVSMGGARAMYYGLKYPEVFFSIGSSQGAFRPFMPLYGDLVRKNRKVLKSRPIQLVTSDKDPMAPSVRSMRELLESEGIAVEFLHLSGPHDYVFNQGPGALSLLLFHDQALRASSVGPVR